MVCVYEGLGVLENIFVIIFPGRGVGLPNCMCGSGSSYNVCGYTISVQ